MNSPGRVFVARRGRSELTTTVLDPGQVQDLVERMLKSSGRRVDSSQPFVDAMLADGSRLHVVIPDITRPRCHDLPNRPIMALTCANRSASLTLDHCGKRSLTAP